jgi:hypothetical protein
MLNCTLGITGLCGLLTGFPGAVYVLRGISWCNSFLSSLVLSLSESSCSGWELEGASRGAVVVVLAVGLLLAACRAAKHPGLKFATSTQG